MTRERRPRPGIRLSYPRTACRCGELRFTGTTCPMCQFRPPTHEVNQAVQRRKRIVQAIRSVTPDPNADFSSTGLGVFFEVLETVTGWMDDFWSALNDVDRDLDTLKCQTLRLLNTIAAFEKIERLRPWRALYGWFDEMLTSLRGVFDFSLVAYEVPTQIEALEAQRNMQAHIDTASDAISKWNDVLHQLGELAGETPESQFIIATAAGFHESSDSPSFVSKLLHNLSLPSEPFPGVASVMITCVELCTILGERQAFADTVSTMLTLLRTQRDKGRQIVESPLFSENFARSLGETHRSGTMIHILAVLSGNERLAVDALVDAAHSIVESGTRHPLALAASVLGPVGYKRCLEKGANECIRYVADQGYLSLVSDLNLDLRNAKAHRSYRQTEDSGVDIFNGRGNLRSHLDARHLIDAVVAGHVLFMGLAIGVVLFACDAGVDIATLVAGADPMPPVHAVQYAALVNGWPLPEVRVSDEHNDTMVVTPCPPIEISADMDQPKMLITAVTMARSLSNEARFVLFCDREDWPLLLDVKSANKFFDNQNPDEASLLYIRFVHSLRRGGLRAISDDEWHKLLRLHAVLAAEGQDGNAIRRLIKLRSVVQELGDNEIAGELTARIAVIRNRLIGQTQLVERRLDLLPLPTTKPPTWVL